MSGKQSLNRRKENLRGKRTWIEIDEKAARRNYDIFRKIVGPKVKLWSVVKSNAYGHGLVLFSKLMQKFGVDGFCVDSLVEGLRLRKEGIKKSILVLGPTLPEITREAGENGITLSIANFEALKVLMRDKKPQEFHVKIDTGMHRQGFYLEDIPKVIRFLSQKPLVVGNKLRGVYTHFASAKDVNYPTYTERQFADFLKAVRLFERAGYKNFARHCSATGGTLINRKYHLDAVRAGIGLYGLWPSKELEMQMPELRLRPVLSWRGVVSEVKKLSAGDYVGYDLTERAPKQTKEAIIPVGYWHGFPRALSGIGEILINGRRSRILGRVSMDIIMAELREKCAPGDIATFIGRDGKAELLAFDVAQKAGTTHYEFLTRLNPLMERIKV